MSLMSRMLHLTNLLTLCHSGRIKYQVSGPEQHHSGGHTTGHSLLIIDIHCKMNELLHAPLHHKVI